MGQRIDYATFPGVREEALLSTVNKVFGHLRRNQLTTREFRDWMKEEGLYNKDDVHHLLAFLDIQNEGQAQLGPWAEKFFAASTEEQMREMIFKRLLDENTLLVKYAMEALDIEGGGRLHSTHEMHRMLTSYVYPGKPITLEPFKNWIKWAVVSGRLKMIGIRWGMTDLGKQAVPRLRTIDVDEFLEDEKAEETAAATRAGQPASEAVAAPKPMAAAIPVPVAAPSPAVAKPSPRKEDDPDEDLDIPGDAEPVDDAAFARYAAQYEEPAPVAKPAVVAKAAGSGKLEGAGKSAQAAAKGAAEAAFQALEPAAAASHQTLEVQVAAPRRDTAPGQVVIRHVHVETGCTRAAPDPAQVVAALRDHGRTRGLGGGSLLLAHGLETRMGHNEPLRHLFLASLIARAYALTGDGSLVDALTERVGGSLAPVALLLDRPEALVDALNRWNLLASDPLSAHLRSLLLDTAVGGKALKMTPDLPTQLAESASSEGLVNLLSQTVLRGAHAVAAFWLVREFVRVGLWTRTSATEVAFVPWRAVRLMAYRLRLIDSHFAVGVPLLLQVAKRLATLLPPGSVEAMALEDLAPGDHLRFDCQAVEICQTPCAKHRSEP